MDRKSRYFDYRFYIEKLHQLRITGILMGLSFLALTAIVSVAETNNVLRLEDYVCSYDISLSKIFIITYIIITPVLTLSSFHFLMVRKSCDFYDAIPHTRICQFITGVLALVTYILVIVLGGSIIHAVIQCYYLNGHVVLSDYVVDILGVIIADFLVMASVILACSVSGTILQAVILSLIIIVVPRCLINMMVNIISENLFFVNFHKSAPFLTDAYSFVAGLKYNDFSAGGIIYTAVLAGAYLILGGIFFHYRKSELAEVSKPGAGLCTVFRILAGFLVSLVFVYIFLEKYIREVLDKSSYVPETKDIIIYSGCIIAVLFVYFLVGIIGNRGKKKFLRLIPGIPVIFIADFIIIMSVTGVCEQYINFRPGVNDIEYVKILADKKYDIVYGKEVYDYFDKKTENMKLTDYMCRRVIASALDRSIDMCPAGQIEGTYNVLIHADGKDYYRTVYLNDTDRSSITESLLINQEYLAMLKEFPDIEDIKLAYYDFLEKEEAEELYQILQADVKNMNIDYITGLLGWLNSDFVGGNYHADSRADAREAIEMVQENNLNYVFSISTQVSGSECTFTIPGEWQAAEEFYERYVQMINNYAIRSGMLDELEFKDITEAIVVLQDKKEMTIWSIGSEYSIDIEQAFSELERGLKQSGTNFKELIAEKNEWEFDSSYIKLYFRKNDKDYCYFVNINKYKEFFKNFSNLYEEAG